MNINGFNIYSKRNQDKIFSIFVILIFFFSVRYGYGIIDSTKYFFILAIILLYYLRSPRQMISPIDLSCILLVIFNYLIGIYEHIFLEGQAYKYNYLPYAWVVPSVYLLGKLSVGNDKINIEEKSHTILYIMGIGMFIQGLLNYGGYFFWGIYKQYDDEIYMFALWRSFWNASTDGTRNNWNNGFIMVIAALFYAIIVWKKRTLFSIAVIVLSFVGVYINILFGGKTLPALMILIFAIMGGIFVITNYSEFSVMLRKIFGISVILVIVIILAIYYMFLHNIAGMADLYNYNYLLNRNGGIIKNVRLEMWRDGLERAFSQQKGGWDLSDKYDYIVSSHNTWIEFARYYDIIVFGIVVCFLFVTLFGAIRIIYLYGKKYPVLYFSVSAELAMFIYGMYEPIYMINQDLLLFFYFICGVTSGIGHVAESGDYLLLGQGYSENKRRFLFFGLGILSMALITNSYIDWWNDRSQIVATIVIPTLVYVIGGMLYKKKYRLVGLSIAAVGSTMVAVYMYAKSVGGEFFEYGYYIEPFTGNTVEKSVFVALWIIPVAVLLGCVCYFFKLNKILVAVCTTLVTGVAMLSVIRDGRLVYIKEALRLQLGMKSGLQWIASKENYLNLRTSHCMWLDFARDYGMVTLGLLAVFEIWSIYCFVRMVCNRRKSLVDYVLIVAFVLFNYHFMFEATAITSKYIFALGLLVYGMVTASIVIKEEE